MNTNFVISINQESMTEYHISDEMRSLIVKYMEACNEQDYAREETLLRKIKKQGEKEYDFKD